MTILILRPLMPPAALTSSTAIFMPLETGTPHPLIGPDRSWWVPMTISVAEMPSLVTLVCALAGRQVSATALTARPNVPSDLDIDVSSPWGPYDASGGAITASLFFKRDESRHRALAIHRVDFGGVALVHEVALQLHGGRELLVFRRELALD